MDRESQELRTYSQSWPPGFFVGSMMLENGARARRRDGLMLVALAVCGWCLGYTLTDWFCDESQRKLAAASAQRAELSAVAQHRSQATAAAANPAAFAEAASAWEGAALAEVASLRPASMAEPVAAPAVVPHVSKRARASSRDCRKPTRKEAWTEEPSPVVSPEEMNKALTLAAASKKIFASVDESAPSAQPAAEVVVRQPTAADVPSAEQAAPVAAKVVAIEALYVEGGVPSKVVNRGVQRLLPQYDRCREFCDSEPQRMKLSTTIDEAGRGRQVTVEGLSRPGLRRCLEQATAHLVVPAPDTGTARARWIVRFASR